jgi:archaellum biogenesis ATPase FlaH
MRIEQLVLKHLINNEDFARKTIPFLQGEYFADGNEKIVFEKIKTFISNYNSIPSREALAIEIDNDKTINDDQFKSCGVVIDQLTVEEAPDLQWLLDKTEKFCQEKAVYNAIMESIGIIDGKDKNSNSGSIPTILSDALSVSFDNHIGHDFLDDAEKRYDFYHRIEEKVPFDIDLLNTITKGGLSNKSLNIILAGTGVGKSLAMCHWASNNLMEGKNVLYITLEMAEERIAERIDANLLNVPLDDLNGLSEDLYKKKVNRVRKETAGKLIIKEYPTASAGTGHFRHLLNELSMKRNFKPDIIYVDYLNIALSMRIKPGAQVNSYSYIKAIAEELRGLAVERNVPVVSATQTTRKGFTNSDPGLEDTSESFGLPATADFMLAIVSSDDLQAQGCVMFKQLKNRYSDPVMNKKFKVGIDRSKMRLFDVELEHQDLIKDPDEQAVMDQTKTGQRMNQETVGKLGFN